LNIEYNDNWKTRKIFLRIPFKRFFQVRCILNCGAVRLRSCCVFRPGSSRIAHTTASCGISTDYLNPINIYIATPLFSILKCQNSISCAYFNVGKWA